MAQAAGFGHGSFAPAGAHVNVEWITRWLAPPANIQCAAGTMTSPAEIGLELWGVLRNGDAGAADVLQFSARRERFAERNGYSYRLPP